MPSPQPSPELDAPAALHSYELGDFMVTAPAPAASDANMRFNVSVHSLPRTPDTLPYATYEESQAVADAAWDRARTYHGPEEEAGKLYWAAAKKLIAATALAPSEKLEHPNPIDMLRVAGSLAMAVEADAVPEYHKPQRDEEGNLINRRENVTRIYSKMLVKAGRMITGEDARVELMLDGEFEPVKPSEVVKSAIHQAGKATDESAALELDEQITQELKITDEAPIVIDPMLAAKTAEITVEELGAAREIPIAA